MIDQAQILTLLRDHGTLILAPVAVLEGPVVSVLAGWMVSLGVMPLVRTYVILVLADLVGDFGFYLLGRHAPYSLPLRLRQRLGVTPRNLVRLRRKFRVEGAKFLLFGKLTHAAGFAVLFAAGVARMRPASFLLFNLLGTLPKTAVFLAIGYFLGNATAGVQRGLLLLGLLGFAIAAVWALRVWRARRSATQ